MKQSSKFLPVIVLCMLFSQKGFSQETKAQFENIDFYIVENKILVTYDLVKTSPQELFEIGLQFENQSTAEIIIPKSVEGDVGPNIKGGKGKEIYWDWSKDVEGLQGEIVPKLEVKSVERIPAGPNSAIKSVFVPGLGDYAVKDHKDMIFKPYIRTVLAYGLVGAGVFQKLNSDKYYDDYMASTEPDEFQQLFDKSQSALNQSALLIGAGAAVWLSDVVWVAVTGAKNKKANQRRLSESIDQKFYIGYDRFGPNLTYSIRF